MKYSYLYFLILLFFLNIKSQKVEILELEKSKQSSLASNSYGYFSLTIPGEIKANYLLLQVKANKELDIRDNIVSDPNLYISQDNKYPNKKENKWSSARFGDEIVSIDAKYFKDNKNIYISVYCESKCNYILTAKLYEEFTFNEKNVYTVTLNKDETIKVSFTSKEKFKKLKINCVGKEMQLFHMFVAKENPSAVNTINCSNSFTNGIVCLLDENNPEYKTKQKYEILLANMVEKQDLILWLKYDDEEPILEELSPITDTAFSKESNCYTFNINKKNENKDIILSVNLFNGKGYLKLGGWEEVKNKEISSKKNEEEYPILSDKSILLTESNFKKFGDYNKGGDTKLHFCFIAQEESSYSIKIYYFENSENAQKLNFLLPGIMSQDILPASKVTSYQLLYFSQNRDIKIDLTNKGGEPNIYIYYSYNNYSFFNKTKVEDLKNKSDLMTSKKVSNRVQRIEILDNFNKCKQLPIVDGQKCEIYAIVECTGSRMCTYEIAFDHIGEEIAMKNRVVYSNVITLHEEDKYRIIINEEETKNIAIVLEQNTGSSKIVMKDLFGDVVLRLNDKKYSENFYSNFVELRSKVLGLNNLKGTIYFQIEGESFASYSLYYYSFDDDENFDVLDHKNVVMELTKGQIIRETISGNHYLKVYGYDNSKKEDRTKNLLMFLDNTDFTGKIYVFKNLEDYSIVDNEIKGYLWESDYYGYINIKSAENSNLGLDYLYIMIAKTQRKNENDYLYKNSPSHFTFGLTDEVTEFSLMEGIEFRQKLTKEHSKQKYQYNHLNSPHNKLQLSIATNGGKLTLTIKLNNKQYISNKIITKDIYYEIENIDIYNYCYGDGACIVDIELSAVNYYELDFDIIILARSSNFKPITLTNSVSQTRSLLHGEKQYFIITPKIDSNMDIKLNSLFKGGRGEIFIKRISAKEQNIEIPQFPSGNNYEYICDTKFNIEGVCSVNIPYNEVINMWPCNLLVTVMGESFSPYISTKLEYSFSLSNVIDELNINKNYKFFNIKGEVKYFHFRINNKKKRISISMTNKNVDANLYLNYGNKLPDINNYQWKSSGGYNEYLDLSVDDSYFIGRKIKDLDGDYYLAVQGLGEGYYNLYISDTDIKISTISEEFPAGCSCEKSGDVCYFRFEINDSPDIIQTPSKELVFYFEFTYGSASIYAKLFDNGNNNEILQYLPNRYRNDYRSKNSQQFLKIQLTEGQKDYTFNSVILLSAICEQKSLFDFNVRLLRTSEEIVRGGGNHLNLQIDSDNIYYISSKSQRPVNLIFYSKSDKEIHFEVKAYSGKATVNLYSDKNDGSSDKNNNKRKKLAEFGVDEKDKEFYFGSINKNDCAQSTIVFEVKASEDCLFFVNFHYESPFLMIPISRNTIGELNKGKLYSYFQFLPEYDEVILTIKSNNPDSRFSAYIKTQILDRIVVERLSNLPSSRNCDLKATSNSFTSTLSLKIKNVPKDMYKKGYKVITLINVVSFTKDNSIIEFLVYPNINHYKITSPEPRSYTFSSLSSEQEDKSIFSLKKQDSKHDLMVIEISSCQGNFDFSITENLPVNENEEVKEITPRIFQTNGKKILFIMNSELEQFYLSVWGTAEDEINIFNLKNKGKDIEFLFQYYSSMMTEFFNSFIESKFSYEVVSSGNIRIKLPELEAIDTNGKSKKIKDVKYSVVITEKLEEFEMMDSICYLSRTYDNYEARKEYEKKGISIKTKENTIFIEGLVEENIYYINILVKNLQSNEIYSFSPEQISPKVGKKSSYLIALLIIFVIMFLVLFYFYRKYKKTKIALNYEVNDSKNLGKLPKSISKLKSLELKGVKSSKDEYNTLSEDS